MNFKYKARNLLSVFLFFIVVLYLGGCSSQQTMLLGKWEKFIQQGNGHKLGSSVEFKKNGVLFLLYKGKIYKGKYSLNKGQIYIQFSENKSIEMREYRIIEITRNKLIIENDSTIQIFHKSGAKWDPLPKNLKESKWSGMIPAQSFGTYKLQIRFIGNLINLKWDKYISLLLDVHIGSGSWNDKVKGLEIKTKTTDRYWFKTKKFSFFFDVTNNWLSVCNGNCRHLNKLTISHVNGQQEHTIFGHQY